MKRTGLQPLLLNVISVFAFLTGCDFNSVEEKEFNRQINNITLAKPVRFSDLEMLQGYTKVCILRPYSVRANAQSESLDQLFGSVDYGPRKKEIYDAANDDSVWSIYLIRDEVIESRLGIKSKTLKTDIALMSGCYMPSNVCLEKISASDNSFLKLTICD